MEEMNKEKSVGKKTINSGNEAKAQSQSSKIQKLPIAQGKTKPGYWS